MGAVQRAVQFPESTALVAAVNQAKLAAPLEAEACPASTEWLRGMCSNSSSDGLHRPSIPAPICC